MPFSKTDIGLAIRKSFVTCFTPLYLGVNFLPRSGRKIQNNGNLFISCTLRSKPPSLAAIKKITFIPGPGLGDVLTMTPTFELLKKSQPHINISVMTSREYFPILETLYGINQLVPFAVPDDQKVERPQVEKYRYFVPTITGCDEKDPSDVYIFVNSWMSQKTMQAMINLSGYKICGFTFNLQKSNSEYFDSVTAAVLINPFKLPYIGIQWGLALLAPLFGSLDYLPRPEIMDDFVQPRIPQYLFDERNISTLMQQLSGTIDSSRPFVFLNFLAASANKQLPKETALSLTKAVSQKFPDIQILVNGGTNNKILQNPTNLSERSYMLDFGSNISDLENVIVLPELTLEHLTQLLYLSSHIFTVDTAVSHISASDQLSHIPSTVVFRNSGQRDEWGLNRHNRHYYWAKNRMMEFGDSSFEGLNQDDFIKFVLKAMSK